MLLYEADGGEREKKRGRRHEEEGRGGWQREGNKLMKVDTKV